MKLRINILITLLLLVVTNIVVGQNRMLKLEDVQSRNYYPTNIYDSKFIDNTDDYTFTKDGKSLWLGTSKEEPKEILKLEDIKDNTPKSFFGIKYANENEFYYTSTNSDLCIYNLKTKQSTIVANFDKQATQVEVFYKNPRLAFKKDDNLFVQVNSENRQITKDGTKDIVYGEAVHRNEFGIDKGLFWSNEGEKLAFYRMDQSMVSSYPLVNTETRIAEHNPVKYPMAGMKSHEVLVGVYDVASQDVVYLKTRKDESLEEREMYLTNISFSPDAKTIYIVKLNRLQNQCIFIFTRKA